MGPAFPTVVVLFALHATTALATTAGISFLAPLNGGSTGTANVTLTVQSTLTVQWSGALVGDSPLTLSLLKCLTPSVAAPYCTAVATIASVAYNAQYAWKVPTDLEDAGLYRLYLRSAATSRSASATSTVLTVAPFLRNVSSKYVIVEATVL